MAAEVVMPRLGWGGEDGSLVEWIKKDGEAVAVGDVICTVEGDKAVNEVEAMDSGILRIPADSPAPGSKVPVGTVLAYLVAPGEPAPFERAGASAVGASTAGPVAERVGSNGGAATAVVAIPAVAAPRWRHNPPISPRARRVAAELGVDPARLTGSGRTGRVVERDVRAVASPPAETEPVRVSPAARRLAEDVGVDVEQLAQSRPGQRITRSDVEEAARQTAATANGHGEPMSGVRRIIAQRMSESMRTVAPVTLTTEADATDLARLRKQIKADLAGADVPVPTYVDLLAKLVAVALDEHPHLNASLVDDQIVRHPAVNVGIAVDTDRGLLVPVLRDVANRSIQRIAEESARLIAQARSGRIALDDLRDGTFTITNLGMYDVDAFTPIVNLPECAILGVGRIVAKPVVVDEANETVAVRRMLALSLTFDHRIVDGAPAARFLQRVKQFVEHPTLWLIR